MYPKCNDVYVYGEYEVLELVDAHQLVEMFKNGSKCKTRWKRQVEKQRWSLKALKFEVRNTGQQKQSDRKAGSKKQQGEYSVCENSEEKHRNWLT